MAVAKARVEDGFPRHWQAPDRRSQRRRSFAEAITERARDLVLPCDLDATILGRKTIFASPGTVASSPTA